MNLRPARRPEERAAAPGEARSARPARGPVPSARPVDRAPPPPLTACRTTRRATHSPAPAPDRPPRRGERPPPNAGPHRGSPCRSAAAGPSLRRGRDPPTAPHRPVRVRPPRRASSATWQNDPTAAHRTATSGGRGRERDPTLFARPVPVPDPARGTGPPRRKPNGSSRLTFGFPRTGATPRRVRRPLPTGVPAAPGRRIERGGRMSTSRSTAPRNRSAHPRSAHPGSAHQGPAHQGPAHPGPGRPADCPRAAGPGVVLDQWQQWQQGQQAQQGHPVCRVPGAAAVRAGAAGRSDAPLNTGSHRGGAR